MLKGLKNSSARPVARHLPTRVQRWGSSIVLGCWLCIAAGGALALEFQGAWRQGGLLLGTVEPGTEVLLEDRAVKVAPDGRFVIALGRDAPAQVKLTTRVSGVESSRLFSVERRSYDIQRVEGVPQETVTPPESVLDRIREEAALVYRARSDNDPRLDFAGGFEMPLEGPITGVYGSQRVYNGVPKNPHYGLDIAAPKGTLVRAPAPGIVKLAHRDMYFSGGTLIVDHGYGVTSTFIHLSDILVNPGDRIETGDAIAKVGATGRATGPHLDWRMNWFDVRVDPALVVEYFPYQGKPYRGQSNQQTQPRELPDKELTQQQTANRSLP